MNKIIAIEDPPEKCPFCHLPRSGIQEGRVFFKCGTFQQYSVQDIEPKTERSLECQKKIELLG